MIKKTRDVKNLKLKLSKMAKAIYSTMHPEYKDIDISGDKVILTINRSKIESADNMIMYDYMELSVHMLTYIFGNLDKQSSTAGISSMMMYSWINYDIHPIDFVYDLYLVWFQEKPKKSKVIM